MTMPGIFGARSRRAHSTGSGQDASGVALLADVEAAIILRLMCAIAQNNQAQRYKIEDGAWVFLPDQHL
jgi:hypothetical protein